MSALDSMCLLAKSAKGAAAAHLIAQTLDHPEIYVFGELIDCPNVQALAGTPSAPSLELLRLFAYGTWSDYKAAAAQLPPLSAAQTSKLKKLSLVSLASHGREISYDVIMRELELTSVRAVEDLLIECFYGGLLHGRLDQKASRLEVTQCAGRDVHPSEVSALCDTLAAWHKNSTLLMASVWGKLERYQQQAEAARRAQADLDAQVEAAKSAIRAQHEVGGDHFGGGGDFDVGMDFEEDKIRKSGRSKNKLAPLAVGPRK